MSAGYRMAAAPRTHNYPLPWEVRSEFDYDADYQSIDARHVLVGGACEWYESGDCCFVTQVAVLREGGVS